MSERMIELHRARLLQQAAGKGGAASGSTPILHQNGSQAASIGTAQNKARIQQTPQQAAFTAMQAEDAQMRLFLQRLQRERDDGQPGEAAFGPTIPTALSRRMLQRQGAGYLDSNVAAIASAAADRFLATVLQQSIACREQRLKGAEIARQEARQRTRHKRHYLEDLDDRKRRKAEQESQREKRNLAAIQAAEALRMKGSGPVVGNDAMETDIDAGGGGSVASKRKKSPESSLMMNGTNEGSSEGLSDTEFSYDSLDEEENDFIDHYRDDDDDDDVDGESDDEEDEVMTLRDMARPLAAWDFHVDGLLGMNPLGADDEDGDEQRFEDTHEMENGADEADSADEYLNTEQEGGPDGASGVNLASESTPGKATKSPADKEKGQARTGAMTPPPGASRDTKPPSG